MPANSIFWVPFTISAIPSLVCCFRCLALAWAGSRAAHNGQYFRRASSLTRGCVQHAGHRAHGIAGLTGNILDGQSCAFFRVDLLPVYHIQPKGKGGSCGFCGRFLFFRILKIPPRNLLANRKISAILFYTYVRAVSLTVKATGS